MAWYQLRDPQGRVVGEFEWLVGEPTQQDIENVYQ